MGSMSVQETLGQVIRTLNNSPVFQLSLASKELFHSNFIAWLCEAYPQLAGRLFGEFIKTAPPAIRRLRGGSEKKNVDLWLTFPNGQEFVIENKVKSVPDRQQLERIACKHKRKEPASCFSASVPPTSIRENGNICLTQHWLVSSNECSPKWTRSVTTTANC